MKRRIKTEEWDFTGMGKVPPKSINLEEVVLGAALLEKKATQMVCNTMEKEHFYKESHQIIFAAIFTLFSKSKAVDILTVAEQLLLTGELDLVGGAYYVSTLTSRVGGSAHIEEHIRIIQQKFIKREVISIGSKAAKDGFEDTVDHQDLLDELISTSIKLNNSLQSGKAIHIATASQENMDKVNY